MPGQFDGPRDIGYDPARECYSIEYDRTRDPPSIELIVAIATIEDRGTDEVEPLYETIDPDALDAIFREESEATAHRNGRLSFVFSGREVTVWAEGRIDIALTDAERERATAASDADGPESEEQDGVNWGRDPTGTEESEDTSMR
ncbi:HalOD1 output domain-containing protein [Haloprofundus halobius]|uniref:HalOD1 output domain-containing protein n=1 Tax=Haloprofundus halobius TaxID=2876194 RepID=UPI001CCF5BA3|nr:HalOD1 output domain-containing protein [Haloprofundus halobius]